MWSVARVYLGLTSAEFWQSTPDEYRALCERHADLQESANTRSFSIVAMLYNVNKTSNDPAKQASDFFSTRTTKPKSAQPRQSAEDMYLKMQQYAEALFAVASPPLTP